MGSARILVFASRPQLFEFAAHVIAQPTVHYPTLVRLERPRLISGLQSAVSLARGVRKAARKNLKSCGMGLRRGVTYGFTETDYGFYGGGRSRRRHHLSLLSSHEFEQAQSCVDRCGGGRSFSGTHTVSERCIAYGLVQ